MAASGGQRGGIIFRLIFLVFFLFLVFLVYLARHPLLRMAGEFWIVDDAPVISDAIVILSDDNYFAERAERAPSSIAPATLRGWWPAAGSCAPTPPSRT